ncbi:MAG: acetate--CoA ligase [Bacteroidetes bacterium]|nr:acetate--CoA ligase [Bacteroidota bacterium]
MKHYPYQIDSLESYKEAYKQSLDNPAAFWGDIARNFSWMHSWKNVLDWNFEEPSVKWFDGAKLNITVNCLDRHLEEHASDIALIFDANDPEEASRHISYQELYDEVNRMALVMKARGIKKGDRVCIYMGMIPELAIAVLACARIGAIHSVIFGGFSARSVADRINDAQAKAVITCDGAYRGAKQIELKSIIDDALEQCLSVQSVFVVNRTNTPVSMIKDRDYWWDEEMLNIPLGSFCEPEPMNAEDPLFILYTSGSTGKPKGVVHSCGGYMVYATYSFVNVFQYQLGEVHFCTADIGWITGHSYIVYGPLCAGATSLMFEGIPTWPNASRFWEICEKHRVNILYTAPTAIRSLMGLGDEFVESFSLQSLRVLGSVGEPINEEAWQWFHDKVGKGRCPIVDTWWQTETGGIMISNIAGITPQKPAFATLPLPGIFPELVNENGNVIEGNEVSGNLVISHPWPATIRTTWGDHERCKQTYFSAYPGKYFTGDGALRDKDGNYRITGRVDDVLNVSGHRIGTAEVENAINMHQGVVESAVVGYPHDLKGQGIYAYVIYQGKHNESQDQLRSDILSTVIRIIGPIAKPDKIQFVQGLPKTRSGKIMRRILRKIAERDASNLGDTSTLLDPSVVDSIRQGAL